MTEKTKERSINFAIALIVSLTGVLMAFDLSSNAENEKALNDRINKKADQTYVDAENAKQDKDIIEVKTLFLFEVQELRKDLRLKAEKQ
jgi:hypothetical protein